VSEFQALHIPPEAFEKGGVEVLRAAIIDEGLHVSLQRAFDDPGVWGVMLADIARHVARAYAYASATGADEDEIAEEIRRLFIAEFDAPTDTGTTSATS
jgi:hypothetical protein